MRDSFVLTFLLVFVMIAALLLGLTILQRREISKLQSQVSLPVYAIKTARSVKNLLIPPPPPVISEPTAQ